MQNLGPRLRGDDGLSANNSIPCASILGLTE
jgi:hypothetical protein